MDDKLTFNDVFRELTFGTKLKSKTAKRSAEKPTVPLRLLPDDAEIRKKKLKLTEPVDDTSGEIRLLSDSLNPAGKIVEKQKPKEDAQVLEEEKIRQIRKLNRIFVWGDEIPNPFIDFTDLELPKQLVKNLAAAAFTEPTPIQMQSIPILFRKQNLLATAPTGSGKTLAFALPLIKTFMDKVRKKPSIGLFAIVVSPTNVLAQQIYVQFLKFADKMPIEIGLLEAGTEFNPNANILVCTPNRLIYTMKENVISSKSLSSIEWLVIDEADRLFDTTENERNFRIQFEEIYKACHEEKKKTKCRIAFFSATFSHEVEKWCKSSIPNVSMVCIGPRNSSNSNVTQELMYTGDESGKLIALSNLINTQFEPPALVFVQSKERAGSLFVELQDRCPNVPIRLMSSELTAEARNQILTKFRTGEVFVLITTEILGRGLDVTVNLVVNFDLPTSVVSYVHRVGRTGRAGRIGRAITFFSYGDLSVIRPIATVIHQAGYEVPEYTLKLNKVKRDDRKWLLKHAPNREAIVSVGRWNRVKKAAMKKRVIKRDPKILAKGRKKTRKLKTNEATDDQKANSENVKPQKKAKRTSKAKSDD
ncbi:hypothetical protein M3Y94_00516400 [Aphelenchoides besseyi]|nr:hypothetical protein M3Y94_00516400 [Aphelenchoides besseyi]KAI6226002.1 putative ATP-dependent RNA helicase DDX52 [Aphelenchoides besseyi]